jgi:hypothetical protein
MIKMTAEDMAIAEMAMRMYVAVMSARPIVGQMDEFATPVIEDCVSTAREVCLEVVRRRRIDVEKFARENPII